MLKIVFKELKIQWVLLPNKKSGVLDNFFLNYPASLAQQEKGIAATVPSITLAPFSSI